MEKGKKVLAAVYAVFGVLFFFIGFSYILNSLSGISGFIILEDTGKATSSLIGAAFVLIGVYFLKKSCEQKKSQAAMEFLMTYGWAILAAIIIIGVLALFGAYKVKPSAAVLSPPLYAQSWTVAVDVSQLPGNQPGIAVEIKNNGADRITITNGTFNGTTEGQQNSCTYTNQTSIGARQARVVILRCVTGYNKGDILSGKICFSYNKVGTSLTVKSCGNIVDSAVNVDPGGLQAGTQPPGGGDDA